MYIYEIEEGTNISVTVKREDASVTLPSEVCKVFSDCILVNLFEHEGNILTFELEDAVIEMVVVKPGEVPFFFKNVQISRVTYEEQDYHCIRTGMVGVKLNRRNAFRAYIGEDGSALEVPGNRRVDVLVKDLSSSGIGLLIDKKHNVMFDLGTSLNVSFSDSLISTSINVVGKIVRIDEQDTQILVGCAFSKHYPQIDRYVAAKQVRKGLNKRKELK